MEDCELCGRQAKDIYVVNVENVELRTCASCAKGKKVIRTESEPQQQKKNIYQRPKVVRDEDKLLIENYAQVVKGAREQMKLPIKVLAEMLAEKEHLILRIEEGNTKPTIDLTKKLEKVLKIKLTEDPVEEKENGNYVAKKSQGATLGDFVQ